MTAVVSAAPARLRGYVFEKPLDRSKPVIELLNRVAGHTKVYGEVARLAAQVLDGKAFMDQFYRRLQRDREIFNNPPSGIYPLSEGWKSRAAALNALFIEMYSL